MPDLSALNIPITAQDKATAVFKQVEAGLGGIEKQILSVKGAAAALAAGIGLGTFAYLIESAISAQAELERFSQRTGLTVETLSILKQATKVAGGDFDQMVAGVQKLDKAMYEAATTGGKSAAAFAGLGIAVVDASGKLRSSDDVLNEVAKAFAGMEDGALKTALAQQLFGKAGAANIPVLNELGASMDYVSKVSTLQAQIAEDLEKNWNRLQASGKGIWNTIAGAITPALDALVKGFLQVINQSGGLREKIAQLAADGTLAQWAQKAAIAVAELADAFVDIGNVAVRLPGALADAAAYLKGFSEVVYGGWLIATGQIKKGADLAATGLEDMKAGFNGVAKTFSDFKASTKFVDAVTNAIVTMGQFTERAKGATPPLEAFTKAINEHGESLKQLLAPINALLDSLGKEGAALDAQLASLQKYGIETKATAVATTLFEIEQGKLAQSFAALYSIVPQLAEVLKALLLQQAAHNDATKTAIELEKEYLEWRKKHIDSLVQGIDKLEQAIQAEKDHAAQIGLTRAEIIDLAIAQEQANDLTRTTIEISQEDVRAQEIRIAKLRELRGLVANTDALEQTRGAWLSLFNSVADRAASFITDFVQHGSSAFKNLWNNFKTWALEAFAKIAAQQVVVSIAGQIAPGLAGTATQAFAGSNPIQTLLGAGNTASNLLSGGGRGLTSFLPGGSASAAYNLFATSGTGASLGLSTAAPFIDTIGAVGTAVEGSIPVLTSFGEALAPIFGPAGIIAAVAIPLLISLFSQAHGPKSGGSASSGVNLATGEALDTTGFGRYFTPSDADSTVKQIVNSVTATYSNVARTLGISLGSASFGLGFDTDPKGTAPNRVSAGAFVGTQQVYNVQNLDVGRDDAQLQQSLALEAQRALLAALQASDLPKYLADLLNGVTASTATQEQINSIIATAQALKTAVDTVSGLGAQFANLDPSQIKGLVDAFGSLQNFTQGFAYLSANFETSAQRAQQATTKLNADFAALGEQVPKNHADFLALLNSLDLTDPAQQKLYASLVNLAPEFVAVAGTADQAAAALAKQVESAQQFFDQNFFSGAEQASQRVNAAWTVVHRAWTDTGAQLQALGYDHIPTTNAGFRALIATVLAVDGADSDLYKTLIQLAPTIFGLNTDLGTLGDTAVGVSNQIASAANTLQQAYNYIGEQNSINATLLQNLGSLAGSASSFSDQLTTAVNLYTDRIAQIQGQIDAASARGDYSTVQYILYPALQAAQAAQANAANELARFTVLSAQFDAARAEQLVKLEDWRAGQLQIFAGMPDALAAVATIFQQRWDAIINGTSAAVDNLQTVMSRINGLIGNFGGNAGDTLRLRIALLNTEIAKALSTVGGGALASQLQAQLALTGAELTLYVKTLTETGSETIAAQILDLQRWYNSIAPALAGNADGLATLQGIFDRRWQEILSGTQSGVNSLLDQYKRIRDFLDGLTTGALSPGTPYDRFLEAQKQYQSQLTLAQGGNADALGSITQYAQTYLQLAQGVFASSSAYTSVFNAVTSALAGLLPAGVTPSGSVTVSPTAASSASSSANYAQALAPLTAALPTKSRIASGDDVEASTKALEDKIDELIKVETELAAALARASSIDVADQTQTLKRQLAAVADAQPVTLKG